MLKSSFSRLKRRPEDLPLDVAAAVSGVSRLVPGCGASPNSSVEFQDSFEVKPTQYAVLENPEHQSSWYARHFLGSFHQNFVGQDNDKET